MALKISEFPSRSSGIFLYLFCLGQTLSGTGSSFINKALKAAHLAALLLRTTMRCPNFFHLMNSVQLFWGWTCEDQSGWSSTGGLCEYWGLGSSPALANIMDMKWKAQHTKSRDPVSSSPWNMFCKVNRKLKFGLLRPNIILQVWWEQHMT